MPDSVIAVRGIGKVTAEDYCALLTPAIERATTGGRKARLCLELGPGFGRGHQEGPKIVAFENTGLGEIPPLGTPRTNAPIAIRSAAEVAADFSYHYWNDAADVPITPSAIFLKGQQWLAGPGSGFIADNAIRIQATTLGSAVPVVSPIIQTLASHRYEWTLVGTKRANARFVVTDRLVSNPSP
jgi:hypothetical protein